MKKSIKIFGSMIFMTCMILVLAGCSESTYEHAKQYEEQSLSTLKEMSARAPTEIGEGIDGLEENVDRMAASGTRYLSKKSKQAGIWIIVGSLLIGVIMVIITGRTSAIKLYKIAWMVFILGIPIITVVSIYGLALLAGWFM